MALQQLRLEFTLSVINGHSNCDSSTLDWRIFLEFGRVGPQLPVLFCACYVDVLGNNVIWTSFICNVLSRYQHFSWRVYGTYSVKKRFNSFHLGCGLNVNSYGILVLLVLIL